MNVGKPYRKEHALSLLKPIYDDSRWTVDERGVWPAIDFNMAESWGLITEHTVLSWKPVLVFKDDTGNRSFRTHRAREGRAVACLKKHHQGGQRSSGRGCRRDVLAKSTETDFSHILRPIADGVRCCI